MPETEQPNIDPIAIMSSDNPMLALLEALPTEQLQQLADEATRIVNERGE
jgi:hypothetical protein